MFEKMPDRQPHDGEISVEKIPEGWLLKHDPLPGGSTNARECDRMIVSDFNAVRLLAVLALVLGVKLDPKQAERIML